MAELACIAVHPDYRRAGFGASLVAALERRATEQGIGTVKRIVMRLPSHPAGPGHLEAELLSRNLVQP